MLSPAPLLVTLLLAASLLAQSPTPSEILDLVRLGYTDAEIRKELEKAEPFPSFDTKALGALERAGASKSLIAWIRQKSQKPPLDLATVDEWLAASKSESELLSKLLARGALPRFGAKELAALAEKGASSTVLILLHGEPLTLRSLAAVARSRLSDALAEKLYERLGHRVQELAPDDSLALLRAGLPKSILEAIRADLAAKAARAALRQPCVRLPLPNGRFVHKGRRFELQLPESWTHYRDVREGQVRFAFSPQGKAKRIEDLDVALTITLTTLDESSVFSGQDAKAVLERLLPLMQLMEPGMLPQGRIESARMGGHDAASLRFRGEPRERSGVFELELRLAVEAPLVFLASAVTREGDWAEHSGDFDRVLSKSRFGTPHGKRRDEPVAAHRLWEKHRSSVVYVEASSGFRRGQGTGFLIRQDGYVLTNWHVIWDSRKGRPHKKLLVRWDEQLRKKSVPARLVGFARRQTAEYRLGGALGGDDVALLKIDGQDHVPLPLCSSARVRLGDPIMTLGFPKSFSLATLSTFLTKGVVTRFNRSIAGRIESFATDAKTTHGSSGGPCIDLMTGAVIGLNTWGYDIGMQTEEGVSLDDFVGYSFVCPIDAALRHFPIVADFGLAEEPELGFFEAFDLSQLCLGQRSNESAIRLAELCVREGGQCPDALWLRATTCEARAWELLDQSETSEAQKLFLRARSSYEQALHHDEEHVASRVALTRLLTGLGQLDEAEKQAKLAIETGKDNWMSFASAAETAMARRELAVASQRAARAAELARDIVPDALNLVGRIAYLRGWAEEGRRAFTKAVQIHDRNFAARAGAAEYFELVEDWDGALRAWQDFADDFASHPLAHYRRGHAYAKKGDLDTAITCFDDATDKFEKHGLVPPRSFFLDFSELTLAKGSATGTLHCLAQQLGHYGADTEAPAWHLRSAGILRDQKVPGLASLHARAAERLSAANGKEREVKEHPRTAPGEAEIVWMMREGRYPEALACDLIANHPLAFAIPREPEAEFEKAVQHLLKRGIPGSVIHAILASGRRFPVQAAAASGTAGKPQPGATQPGATQPGQPAPAQPGDAQEPKPQEDPVAQRNRKLILGTWAFRAMDPRIGRTDIRMTFKPNGQFQILGVMGGFQVNDSGDYEVDRSTLTAHVKNSTNPVAQGQINTWPIKLSQTTMQLHYASFRKWITFQRVGR